MALEGLERPEKTIAGRRQGCMQSLLHVLRCFCATGLRQLCMQRLRLSLLITHTVGVRQADAQLLTLLNIQRENATCATCALQGPGAPLQRVRC